MFPSNVKRAAIFPSNVKQAAIFPANEKKTANSQRVFDMSNCLHLILADANVQRLWARGGEDFTADFTADLTEYATFN